MSAPLHNLSLVKHANQIRVLNCAQPVRDRDSGALLRDAVQGLLDDSFALRVQRRRCFIKKQDFGLSKQCPGNTEPLLLATAQERPRCANGRSEAVAVRLVS